jgi:hypothetical protein
MFTTEKRLLLLWNEGRISIIQGEFEISILEAKTFKCEANFNKAKEYIKSLGIAVIEEENIFLQRCNNCGKEFKIKYLINGNYDYIDMSCECESDFSPATSEIPSISQWLNKIKGVI